jgi:hypothetical protein
VLVHQAGQSPPPAGFFTPSCHLLSADGLSLVAPAAAGTGHLQEFFRALSLVRSRTFSGPYVASTLSDRLRLAGEASCLTDLAAGCLQGPCSGVTQG